MTDTPRRAPAAPVGRKPEAPKEFVSNGALPPVTLANDGTPLQTAFTKEEQLARLLCEADGQQPNGYLLGEQRWRAFEPIARLYIVAFEFLSELKEGEDRTDG